MLFALNLPCSFDKRNINREICIPYVDPALFETRSKILQISYGFKCGCSSCRFLDSISPLPEIPTNPDISRLTNDLRDFAGIYFGLNALPTPVIENMPRAVQYVLREDFITMVSEKFSEASHEGNYGVAIDTGLTLLALYVVIYPPNYPQIGESSLEYLFIA